MTEGQLGEEVLGEQTPGTEEQKTATNEEIDYDEQEGKSLDGLAGEGHIATPGGIETGPQEGAKAPTTEAEIMKPVDFKTGIFGMRGDIELVKSKVDNWMIFPTFAYKEKIPEDADVPEIKANLELAYRHLESSEMRLGKALQAFDGGKSCYKQ